MSTRVTSFPTMAPQGTVGVKQALSDALSRVLQIRNPWKYVANSCHLDTWLMEELSFFGYLAESNNTFLDDNLVLNSPGLCRLLKVLLEVGTTSQDTSKMAYWIMEIEEYRGGTRNARKEFQEPMDYHRHSEYLALQLRHEEMDMSYIEIGMTKICDNPKHIDQPHIRKNVSAVSVDDFWYTLPDEWNRKQDEKGRWHTNISSQQKHDTLADVMDTLLGRSEGETTTCTQCSHDEPGSAYQVHWVKDPQYAKLPISLKFVVDPEQTVPAATRIFFGGLDYTLLSVVFGNGNHFKTNLVFRGNWYHYDSIGFKDPNAIVHREVRIGLIHPPFDHMVPSKPSLGYVPVAYRYIRTDATTMSSVELPDVDKIPSDLQFNSMWRLLVDAY